MIRLGSLCKTFSELRKKFSTFYGDFHSGFEKNPWWKAGSGITLPDSIVLSWAKKKSLK